MNKNELNYVIFFYNWMFDFDKLNIDFLYKSFLFYYFFYLNQNCFKIYKINFSSKIYMLRNLWISGSIIGLRLSKSFKSGYRDKVVKISAISPKIFDICTSNFKLIHNLNKKKVSSFFLVDFVKTTFRLTKLN